MNENKLDLSPFCMRARSFLAQGRIEDALALYGDVIQVDPDNMLAYADRGTAYAMQEKFDLALRDLERAFALGYVEASAYCTVGTIYFKQRQLQKSLEYFGKAVALDPYYPFIYYNRASTFHAMGDNSAAIADLEKCLEFDPDENLKPVILRRLDFLRTQSEAKQ